MHASGSAPGLTISHRGVKGFLCLSKACTPTVNTLEMGGSADVSVEHATTTMDAARVRVTS